MELVNRSQTLGTGAFLPIVDINQHGSYGNMKEKHPLN
jgi:hypothetical protein